VAVGLDLTPGTLIDGRYRIQRVLGRGGFGRTYLAADDRRFGELCVLKEFAPSNQSDPVVAQKLRELFQREATILHKLDHPQIPQFFEVFEEDGRLFIVQEFINGKTCWRALQERQKQGEAFSETEILYWLKHLLRVLDYLHSQNIVHRDIAPDNIMLPKGSNVPVLIDFGVVKQAATHFYGISTINPDGLIQASVSVGKFGYAPYEQIRMGQCSPKSDLYALAVTAVVLLTGKSPNVLIDPRSLDWVWQSQVRLHPRFVEILEKMMAEKPQDRYASARLVLRDLQLLDALSRRAAPRSPQRQPRQQQPRQQHSQQPQQSSPLRHSPNILTQNQLNPTGIKLVSAPYHLDIARLQSIAQPISANTARGSATAVALTRVEVPTELVTKLVTLANQTCSQVYTEVLPSELYPSEEKTRTDLLPNSTATPIAFSLTSPAKAVRQQVTWTPWLPLKTLVACGLLALLPVGGILVGVRSPQIASVCHALHNCVGDQQSEMRYRQAVEQAAKAKTLLDHAQTVSELRHVHDRLLNALSQLGALPANAKVYVESQQALLHYQGLLRSVESDLDTETRAAQLLQRAEAEAQKAAEQTKLAQSVAAYKTARSQWSRVLATLNAVDKNSFAHRQVVARTQEYTARLEAVNLRIPQVPHPQGQPELPSTTVVQIAVNPSQVAFSSASTPSAQSQPTSQSSTAQSSLKPVQQLISSSQISSPYPIPAQAAPKPSSSSGGQSTHPSSALAPSQTAPRSTLDPEPAASSSGQLSLGRLHTVPLQTNGVSRSTLPQIMASAGSGNIPSTGNVQLSAFQTLNNVSLGLNGAWINPGGTYVANLVMQNDSDRAFGFVPVFAEVKDASGQAVQARILLRGSEDGIIQPGGTLRAQLYLLDRRWISAGTQNLTLVIHEGTSGSRNFSLAF
jgi:serine/threonine protein kinase